MLVALSALNTVGGCEGDSKIITQIENKSSDNKVQLTGIVSYQVIIIALSMNPP